MSIGCENRSAPFSPLRLWLEAAQFSAGVMAGLMPMQGSRLAWAEFRNRLQAFNLFQEVESIIGLPAKPLPPLPEAVALAQALHPYESVWAIEGLGHRYAEACWETGCPPHRLLAPSAQPSLPRSALIPLHAGMGLSLASRVLRGAGAQLADGVERFLDLCRSNSWPGYQGAAIEALGLVARNLHPESVPELDRRLLGLEDGLAAYFWHGVGRGIYFAPTNFLPLASLRRRALEQAWNEPRHQLGRRNAIAGLSWALTLINIRQPEIVADHIRCQGSHLPDEGAFSWGIASSLLIWRLSSQDSRLVDDFCSHSPVGPGAADAWERLIKKPCRQGIGQEPVECPERLFRCP